MITAADDALKSAIGYGYRTSNLDKKFGEVIHLLSGFEKDFTSKHPTFDPNIGLTATKGANMSDESGSPSAILHALKENLHGKVKFLSVSLPLNVDES